MGGGEGKGAVNILGIQETLVILSWMAKSLKLGFLSVRENSH